MSERNETDEAPRRPRSDKLSSAQKHILWARSLSNEAMIAILQDALVRCRARQPNTHEVVLTEQVVHELKNRLARYHEIMGELEGDRE